MAYTTINKPSDYFNTITYTGDGNTRSLTGVGFQPDLVWVKERNGTNSHNLWDIVRGATKGIFSDQTAAEITNPGSGYVTSFDSDGFSVQAGSGSIDNVNRNTGTYVGWNWLAGGTASSNTDGSITSSVSANTTSGFSIVSYTGTGSAATIGHSLGVAPSMIIVKNRSATADWKVYHKSLGATKWLKLSATDAAGTSSGNWNDTEPTSSVFSVGTDAGTNGSGNSEIAYCFAEKKGFSKFGSYTGNGSTDGTFVYTGFKPAFVLMKRTDSTSNWVIFDTDRDPFNLSFRKITANTSNAEDASGGNEIDILSNGFKTKSTNTDTNASGGTYIYMAFAENPLVTTGKIPATAR